MAVCWEGVLGTGEWVGLGEWVDDLKGLFGVERGFGCWEMVLDNGKKAFGDQNQNRF